MTGTLEARKKAVIYIRAILTTLIILMALYNLGDILHFRPYILVYIIILIISNFVFIALPEKHYEGMALYYLVFILDIIFISLGAYWLAYLDFIFFMAIFITLFMCALSKNMALSFLIALVINVLYFYIKHMTAGGDFDIVRQSDILLNIPFLFIVAVYGSYLAERSEEELRESNALKSANRELSGRVKDMGRENEFLMSYMENTYDSFRMGIIVIDNYGVIRHFNGRCEAIFGVRRGRIMNYNYKEAQPLGYMVKIIGELILKNQESFDRVVQIEADGKNREFIVNTSRVRDKSGAVHGFLCVITAGKQPQAGAE